ncbi:YceI family protein [Acetobacter estunensis]|uniref:YceI family protein n=1 Tax=Acetobacter estunensis TaxID=104097 RepID=UPI001C2DD5E0|nr:YceI family protein [Acetobacter estunensis]MBV1836626.1 YceI family protein [Acetobacter estunensis]
MQKHLLAAATFLGVLCSFVAAHAAPLPADVKSGIYGVEPAHTQVIFSLLHFGFTHYSGLLSDASGTLAFDPKDMTKTKLNVVLKVDSLQTTSPRLTSELKTEKWLDTGRYPTATFVSGVVTSTGEGAANIAGNLTLHGITKPIVLQATFIGSGENPMDKAYTLGFEGTTTISRSEFGVKTYVPMVGDQVQLTIAGAFERE